MQSQREILKIKSLCQQTSKPSRTLLCMLRALPHVPGKAEAAAERDGASVTGQWVPARSLQVTCSRTAREQQPTWAAQVSAVPPCHQKLYLWWPVERKGLLMTHQDSLLQVSSGWWYSRTAKPAKKKKHTEKQLSYFQAVQDYSFLEREERESKLKTFK